MRIEGPFARTLVRDYLDDEGVRKAGIRNIKAIEKDWNELKIFLKNDEIIISNISELDFQKIFSELLNQ